MRKNKWILLLCILLIAMPSYASDGTEEENKNLLKFEDVEALVIEQNPTVEINNNMKENLYDSRDAIRDAKYDKRDLEDAIDGIEDAIDGFDQAIDQQNTMIEGLNEMLLIGENIPGEGKPEWVPDFDIDEIPIIGPAKQMYEGFVGVQIGTLEFVKILYKSNLASLEQNKEALENQLKEFDRLPGQEMELNKAILQIEMGNESIVWGAQNLYLAHSSLQRQRDDLIKNLELLEAQINIMKIQERLGMVTSLDINETIKQKDQIILGMKNLETQMANIKRELNVMLGQDFYKDIELEDCFIIDEESLSKINYEDDLKLAQENSYSVKITEHDYNITYNNMEWADMHGSSDEIRTARRDLESAKIKITEEDKNVELQFIKAYQELQNKIAALNNENKSLQHEQKKLDIVKLKYKLGTISKIELQQGKAEYDSQNSKVKTAEQDLFQNLLQYKAFLKGVDFIQ